MKAEILARVREAIGKRADDIPISRDYKQAGTLDREGRIAQFVSRLEDYNAGVYCCGESDLPQTVLHAMNERGKRTLVIPPGLPDEWLPANTPFIRDPGLSYADLDRSEGVLTGCTVAISLTGSIVLSHSENEGRRALTLIPDYHLCLVRTDQLVETVPEGFRRLRAVQGRPITTISGPSATADIEMTRIKGVHGPRFLDVILVRSSE